MGSPEAGYRARWPCLTAVLWPQEYLEVQRQLAIQRLQEQEKERQMRLEQQKQTIQMRAHMPAFALPYAQVRAPIPHPASRGLLATT